MSWFFSALLTGAIAFAATNIDDIVVLMMFFAQRTYSKRHIYSGQYLGFTAIVLCSLPGFFGGAVIPKTWIGWLGIVPIVLGVRSLLDRESEEAEIQTTTVESSRLPKFITQLFAPQTLSVAMITFANGGDNIATYVSLFVNTDGNELAVMLAVFFALVGVWGAIAQWLAQHPTMTPMLTRYGHILVPLVLIGLGLYILIDNQVWQ
jgi:cadmium resistance transport/sequestration family protein